MSILLILFHCSYFKIIFKIYYIIFNIKYNCLFTASQFSIFTSTQSYFICNKLVACFNLINRRLSATFLARSELQRKREFIWRYLIWQTDLNRMLSACSETPFDTQLNNIIIILSGRILLRIFSNIVVWQCGDWEESQKINYSHLKLYAVVWISGRNSENENFFPKCKYTHKYLYSDNYYAISL